MNRIVWLTDPHLNFLPRKGAFHFGDSIRDDYPNVDAAIVTGDIAEFESFLPLLDELQRGLGAPIYYVLGNHDAYGGSVSEMRVRATSHANEKIIYLPAGDLYELTPDTALVGVDGWYDARLGDARRSNVVMNDFQLIREFRGKDSVTVAREIADREAEYALEKLRRTASVYKRILFATHVPPYAMATWHEGQMSDKHWLPWMSSLAMGNAIDTVSAEHLDVLFEVFCGHTHSDGVYERHSNVIVRTGHSAYRFPRVCGVIEL